MGWKKLTRKGLEDICWIENGQPMKNCDMEILKTVIKQYGFVDYSEFNNNCSIMYALSHGDFRAMYTNPQNKMYFYKKYGRENPAYLYSKLFDHMWAFRDANKKMYLMLSPYMTREEIIKELETFPKASVKYGNYSQLKYMILNKSYYYPGKTTTILLYV